MRISLSLLAIAAASAAPLNAQTAPNDLNQFGLICFCNSRVATPHQPIALDNNGRLLFEARNRIDRRQLAAAGVPATDSQLRMLQDWGLLVENKSVLTTAFPVLDPAHVVALRQRLTPARKALLPLIAPDVAAIRDELERRQMMQSTYAALFSYVLDGLVWRKLETAGKLPKTDISIEHPFWAGTFWAVYPKQDAMPGTNSLDRGRYSLRLLWTPRVIDQIRDFQGARTTAAWLDAMQAGQPLPPLYAGSAIPPLVIREDRNDPIFLRGSRIADTVAAAMLKADLSAELPQADPSQRLLIGTHELIWMVLADIVATHGVQPPKVLTSGAKRSSDLAPLVVGIVKPGGTP